MENSNVLHILSNNPTLWGYIDRLIEYDFGCEGLPDGKELYDTIHIVTKDGTIVLRVLDDFLLKHHLDEGSWIDYDTKLSMLQNLAE